MLIVDNGWSIKLCFDDQKQLFYLCSQFTEALVVCSLSPCYRDPSIG